MPSRVGGARLADSRQGLVCRLNRASAAQKESFARGWLLRRLTPPVATRQACNKANDATMVGNVTTCWAISGHALELLRLGVAICSAERSKPRVELSAPTVAVGSDAYAMPRAVRSTGPGLNVTDSRLAARRGRQQERGVSRPRDPIHAAPVRDSPWRALFLRKSGIRRPPFCAWRPEFP